MEGEEEEDLATGAGGRGAGELSGSSGASGRALLSAGKRQLLTLCREALEEPDLIWTDDFRVDIGVDSVRIARLSKKLGQALAEGDLVSGVGRLKVPTRNLLTVASSVASLAEYLDVQDCSEASTCEDAADSCPAVVSGPSRILFGDAGEEFANLPHQHKGVGSLVALFQRTAKAFPDRTCVKICGQEEGQVSYAELDAAATAIAQEVFSRREKGHSCIKSSPPIDGPEFSEDLPPVVAVLLPRSSWHVFAAHLAVLKAGCVVLMLEPNLPDARLQYMVRNSGCRLILCGNSASNDEQNGQSGNSRRDCSVGAVSAALFGEEWGENKPALLDVVAFLSSSNSVAAPAALPNPSADRPATLFYTSGSTGNPKAVVGTHAAFANYLLDHSDNLLGLLQKRKNRF